MKLSARQKADSKNRYARFERQVDEGRIKRILQRFSRKVERLRANPPASLKAVWDDVGLMGALLRDYSRGEYTAVPWRTISSIAGAVIYFVTPFDAIFDYVPVAGFVDDAMIIKLAVDLARDDLHRYAQWKAASANARDPGTGEPAGQRSA